MTNVSTGPGGPLDLDNVFSYHAPTGDVQIATFQRIRNAGREFAQVLAEEVPPSPERSLAISRVREAVMWGNAGIACNPEEE